MALLRTRVIEEKRGNFGMTIAWDAEERDVRKDETVYERYYTAVVTGQE